MANEDGGMSLSEGRMRLMVSEPSEEMMGLAKLLAALVEHSADWLVGRLSQGNVQALLGVILRLTSWPGTGNVDEQISEVIVRMELS